MKERETKGDKLEERNKTQWKDREEERRNFYRKWQIDRIEK